MCSRSILLFGFLLLLASCDALPVEKENGQPNDVQLHTGYSYGNRRAPPKLKSPCDRCYCLGCEYHKGFACDTLAMLGTCMCQAMSKAHMDKCLKVDCAVSSWGAWGKCSKTCGTGSQTRTRKVTKQPKSGGAKCPALKATQKCNTHGCPVNCVVNSWGAWSKCSKGCGSGLQTRSRSVKVQSQHGGTKCPALKATQKCNTHGCPVNCVVNSWGAWSKCSKGCGGGLQTRSRSVKVQSKNGGQKCPAVSESKKCNTHGCKPACKGPSKSTKDAGYPDKYRGWYDVQGCGKCQDYCRWVGCNPWQAKKYPSKCKSGGDPAKNRSMRFTWWSCRRAGTNNDQKGHYSPRGTYSSWKFKKCKYQGAPAPK